MIRIALLIVGIVLGWYAHLCYCQRRHGCPLWRQLDTGEWAKRLAVSGWRTKNGVRHHLRPEPERHPTPPAEALDGRREEGVPLPNTNGVETKPANPKRRT